MIDFKGTLIILSLIVIMGGCFFISKSEAQHTKYENMMEECYDDYSKMMPEFKRVWNHVTDLSEEELRELCITITNKRLENE